MSRLPAPVAAVMAVVGGLVTSAVLLLGVLSLTSATTAPSRQASASRWMVHTAWPRRAASRIIAMLESL